MNGKSHDLLCVDDLKAWAARSARTSGRSRVWPNFATICAYLIFPGVAPPEFVTLNAEVHDHGTYTHNEGSMDEWSLTWTKVDGEANVID
jgi:hypothetical protein